MCTKVFSSPTTKSIEDIVSEFSENTHDNDNADDNNSIADFLYKAAENPMNLNEINREYLEQFPFLNETQIENLLEYRNRQLFYLYKHQQKYGYMKELDDTELKFTISNIWTIVYHWDIYWILFYPCNIHL